MDADSRTPFIPTAERPTRSGPTPTVAIVIVAAQGGEGLDKALNAATEAGRLAVLVVHRGNVDPTGYARPYPEVRWFAVGAEATDAELRERGMSEADGDIVRFLDDRFPATWSMAGIP